MKRLLLLLVLGLGLSFALPATAAVRDVKVGSFYFEDSSVGDGKVVIDAGDQITFAFQGNTIHTATVDGMFDSGRKSSPQTYTTGALTRPGTYTLYCSVHGVSRHSTTLVIRSTTAPPPPPPSPSPSPAPAPSSTGGSTTGGSTTGATTTKASASPSARPVGRTGRATTSAASATKPTASLAPVGDGVAAPGTSADAPVVPGSLTDVLGRQPAAHGSWTRSIRLALLLLLPMLAAAGWALRRRRTAA